MANEARPCPCDIGDKFDHEGKGQEIQIEHIKAYVCKPHSSTDKAIIVVQDIFGWELPNTRFIADLISAHGYVTICPDFYAGQDAWKPTDDWSTFPEWLKSRPATGVNKEVDVVLKYLKEQCHVRKIGVIGFCWGGAVTHHLMLKYPEIKAGVSFYGIIRDADDRYDLKNPTLFIFAENDAVVPLEQANMDGFIEALRSRGVPEDCLVKLQDKDELDTVVKMWNNHRIRPSNDRDMYYGRPFLMYNLTELYQARDYLKPVDSERMEVSIEENVCLWKSDIPCDPGLYELCVLVLEESNLEVAETASEAFRLYRTLRPRIREHLFGI